MIPEIGEMIILALCIQTIYELWELAGSKAAWQCLKLKRKISFGKEVEVAEIC